jgi:putative transcriptional regulator
MLSKLYILLLCQVFKFLKNRVEYKMSLKKNLLKEFRENKSISQNTLAEKLGVTRQTIISIEKDRYIPSLELAIKISRYFKCKVEDIFDI